MSNHRWARDPLIAHLDAIDAGWSSRRPVDVRTLAGSAQWAFTSDQQADLLAADLEWRWRSVACTYRLQRAESDHREYRQDDLPKPVEEYALAFPQLRQSESAMMRLVEAEFIARSRWNNPPAVADFVARFAHLGDLRAMLLAALDEVAMLRVIVEHDGEIRGR